MATVVDVITVTGDIQDASVSVKSFGEGLILTDETPLVTISTRTKQYTSTTDIATDWGNISKVYKASTKHFAQNSHNETLKIGLELAGDASTTAALDAIWAEDNSWFDLHSIFNTKAKILEIAAWAATKGEDIQYGATTEDADVLVSGTTTDVISTLAGLNYDNVYIKWYHQSGVDATGVSITVASLVATVTEATHGLRVGDNVTVSGADGSDLNGNKIVASVPTAGTWTYATTESDGADANNGSIDYFARYEFIDVGWSGRQLGRDIGTTSWDGKTLIGFAGTPKTILTDAQVLTVQDKGGNVYITRKGATYTNKGRMVSDRFIENNNVLQWLIARITEENLIVFTANEKVPYTNSGFEQYATATKGPLNTQIQRTGLSPLNDEENFRVTFPNALDISTADRLAGEIPNAEVLCRIGQSVHKIVIDITAIV